MIGQYQFNNQEMQKEISAVIEKDTTISNELTQLKNSECDCESDITAIWHFPIICIIGYVFLCIGINHLYPYGNLLGYFFIFIGSFIGIKFNCDWY